MFGFDVINDIPTTNKTVFLRCDFNVPLGDYGEIIDDSKIKLSLPTIKYLIKTGARVVIGTHIGNPNGKFVERLSTKVIYKYLQRVLRCEVHFCNDCVGEDVKREIFRASYGDVVVLENLKFHKEEEMCDFDFAKQLADGMNIYVNDAFACSHLKYSSIIGLPLFIRATAGLTLAHDVNKIKDVFEDRNTLAIIGGRNILSKIEILNNLVDKVQYLAVAGTMANTFFTALGNDIGKSLRSIECNEDIYDLIKKAEKTGCKIILPVDVVVAKDIASKVKIAEKSISKIEDSEIIADIGAKSINNIKSLISSVNNVIWYGSVGISEFAKFSKGNTEIFNEISKQTQKGKITSLLGGKNVVELVKRFDKYDDFSFVAKSNHAFSILLSGKILSGLEILHRLSKVEN